MLITIRHRLLFRYVSLLTLPLLVACSIKPLPLSKEELKKAAIQDRQSIFSQQRRVSHTMTLYDAMAYAIKHNFEHRLQLMENALAQSQWDLSRYDMLPTLTASAGYSMRNNSAASTSSVSTTASTSTPKKQFQADLSLSWNILDTRYPLSSSPIHLDQVGCHGEDFFGLATRV
ncbi:TolC family protein [Magnetococcales bacterium HHB-1]